jgi:hypothetical protein
MVTNSLFLVDSNVGVSPCECTVAHADDEGDASKQDDINTQWAGFVSFGKHNIELVGSDTSDYEEYYLPV